ncbi:hypothetical protein H4R34_006366, partial [Dimargaris verticillata]
FATGFDYLLLFVGTIAAAAAGVSQPLMAVIFGDILQGFTNYNVNYLADPEKATADLDNSVQQMVTWFGVLAGGTFVAVTVQIYCWSYSAERQTRRMRELYYEAILRQEIAWFDQVSTGDLTARISGDVNIIQDGIASKFARLVQDMVTFTTGFILAFIKGWQLAIVLLAVLPLLALAGTLVTMLIATKSTGGQSSYGAAGAVAEEVISGIRTVMAFGGQECEIRRYDSKISEALRQGIRKAIIGGIGTGVVMSLLFFVYALGFWYGIKLASEKVLMASQVLTVFFALMVGAMALGKSIPNITSVGTARGAASKVFAIIARESPIDPLADTGHK